MKMWSQVDFCSGNINITMFFQIKKLNSKDFAQVVFCAPEMLTNILRFNEIWFRSWYGFWHLINCKLNVEDAWFPSKQQILWVLQNKLNSDFCLTCIVSWSTMKTEKMKMLSEAKVRYSFPKNIEFHICPVFWAILRFYQKFHWKVYGWCKPNLIFFLVVISIALSFHIKKSNSKNFVHMGFRGCKVLIKIWDFAAGMDSFT